jgi:hypothetical protein
MEAIAIVLALIALIVSMLAFALHTQKARPTTILIMGNDNAGEIIFKRLGQIDRGMLRFATDGDSIILPTAELQKHPGKLAWVLVTLHNQEIQEKITC